MLILQSINYDARDIISLLKENASLISGIPTDKLYVNLKVPKNGKLNAEVVRLDKKDFQIKIDE